MHLSTIVEKWDGCLYCCYNVFAKMLYIFRLYKTGSIIKKNKVLKSSFEGKRCFVLMNGPSIKNLDLSKLENEIVFTANFFFRSPLADVVKPNFHCWIDSKSLIGENGEELKKEIRTRMPYSKMIMNIKGYNGKNDNDIFYTYNKHLPNLFGIKTNLASCSSGYSTVALYAISCAIYMGFRQIYVLGMDFPPGAFKHFDDTVGETEDPTKKETKEDVCGNYWSYTKAHYEAYALYTYALNHGVHIVNLNRESCIRAFEFDDYSNII